MLMAYVPSVVPEAQQAAMDRLEREGYRFGNWYPSHPDADGASFDGHGIAVMVKRGPGLVRLSREVEPDGSVN